MNIAEKKAEIIDWVKNLKNEDLIQILDNLKSESLTEEEKLLSEILELSNKSKKITPHTLSIIHTSEPTRQAAIPYAVFCLQKKSRGQWNYCCSG